jgi:hypothetical protein
MQKTQNYPLPDQDSEPSLIEDSQSIPIPNWHKIIVVERLRTRNKSENCDMSWEEIIHRLKSQHENL